jgi:valyl-tRNA synthetase
VRQETDVLDTWFSSGLWPFSTMGWPDATPELKVFYPTSVLVTGFDILFFWVARMIMFGLRFMGDVPFRDVYIHALVRDAEGQKMSKSKGNVIDPLAVMERYGTDAFRFTLAALAAQGRDIRLAEERIEGSRNFANKLWNAARFVLANLDGYTPAAARRTAPALAERWIEGRLHTTTAVVRRALRRYRFNDAASALYQFIWHELCDWYLEMAKLSLYRPDAPAARLRTQHTLVTVLESALRLLHPFMPFITEEIWQQLPHRGVSIMRAPYPRARRVAVEDRVKADMETVIALVTALRNIRGEMRIAPGVVLTATARAVDGHAALFEGQAPLVEALARVRLSIDLEATRRAGTALAVVGASEVYVDLAGVVDLVAERQRLDKEVAKVQEAIAFVGGKLARPEFVERAPAEIVERERARLAEHRALLDKLEASRRWIDDGGA